MGTYIVSYDLHKKGEDDYENLIAAIKEYPKWCHMLESDWVIVSENTAVEIRDNLAQHMHKDDKLFVGRLSGEGAWRGFTEKISNWLKENL